VNGNAVSVREAWRVLIYGMAGTLLIMVLLAVATSVLRNAVGRPSGDAHAGEGTKDDL